MTESKGVYGLDGEAAVTALLLRLFTVAQLEAICEHVQAIRANGYGEVTICVDGDRLYLRPSPSISLGKVKE